MSYKLTISAALVLVLVTVLAGCNIQPPLTVSSRLVPARYTYMVPTPGPTIPEAIETGEPK